MKPCYVTKFIKFYKARDSANRPKTGRNCAHLASFLLLVYFLLGLNAIHQVDMKTSVKIMIRMFMLFLDSTNLHTEI